MIRLRSEACACGTDLPGTCPGIINCPYSGYEEPMEDRASRLVEELDVGEDMTECTYCGSRTEIVDALSTLEYRHEQCLGCGQKFHVYDDEEDPDLVDAIASLPEEEV